jgi:hypothetical protein
MEKIKDVVVLQKFVTGYYMTCLIPKSSNLRSLAATTSSLPKPEFLYSVPEGTFALGLTCCCMNTTGHVGNSNLFLITIAINQAPQKVAVLSTSCLIQILLCLTMHAKK